MLGGAETLSSSGSRTRATASLRSDVHGACAEHWFGLDEKAIEAVGQWRFEPGKKCGKPLAVLVQITVRFEPPPR